MVELALFVISAAVAVSGAIAVIRARNPVYAAMGLLATLFALAVIYVVHLAHLVAAVQVIVYAGAVMTLFLFVIMLIGVDKREDTTEQLSFQRPVAIGLVGLVLLGGGFLWFSGAWDWLPLVTEAADPQATNGTVQAVAEPLFTSWVLAFEATGLLLTIAAAGAIALASSRQRVPRSAGSGGA
ncbi:MAG TPA: NADH-quinone oxidoreductase subunit J [Acidimicrobiia bacterium]|jgi:NADH-quinone oxidoreductase subunit J